MSEITIIITNTKGNKIELKMNKTDTLGKLKELYIKRINGDLSSLQIRFDGEILLPANDNKTLDDLGIGDKDQLTSNDRSLGGKIKFFGKINKLIIIIH